MKTVLTFVAGLLLTLTTMAADRPPSVTIKSNRNFEIVVDGRTYRNDNSIRLDRMRKGVHTIKVYERSRGFFGRMRLVSAKKFIVKNNDLRITVGYNGYVNIDERGYDRRGRDWDRNDGRYDHDRDWDRNDRDYGRNRGY
ncbi:MAG TPA: hypothetical protein VJ765_15465 [Chitinophagaceae bacterium]|nr:hypothetical protein [Chitinophagaceae bacterium]